MKHLIRILLPLFCLALLAGPVLADGPEGCSYHIVCDVARNGALEAELDVTLDLPQDTESVVLPLPGTVDRVKTPGCSHRLDTTEDGANLLTLTRRKGFPAGPQTFTVSWTAPSRLTGSQACTMTYQLLSSRWDRDIADFSFQLNLPHTFAGQPRYESGYYGPLDGNTVSASVAYGQISGSVDGGFMAYDAFQVAVDLPDGYFTVPSAAARYLWSLAGILHLITLLLIIQTVIYWFRRCRFGSIRVSSRALPPDSAVASDLPFLLSGAQPDTAALLLEWAVHGYLSIHLSRDQVLLRRRMLMGNERSDWENRLFQSLFGQESLCQLPSHSASAAFRLARKQSRKAWRGRLFAAGRGSTRLLKLLGALSLGTAGAVLVYQLLPKTPLCAVLCLISFFPLTLAGLYIQHCAGLLLLRPWQSSTPRLVLVLTALISLIGLWKGAWLLLPAALLQALLGLQTAFGECRSEAGLDTLRQVLGFRRYVLDVTNDELRTALRQDPMYFYRLLPWAEALGVGSILAQRFGKLSMEEANWFNTGRREQTAQLFYQSLEPVLTQLRQEENQTTTTRKRPLAGIGGNKK